MRVSTFSGLFSLWVDHLMLGARVKEILSFGLLQRIILTAFSKKLKRKSSNGLHFCVGLLMSMNEANSEGLTRKMIKCPMRKVERIN